MIATLFTPNAETIAAWVLFIICPALYIIGDRIITARAWIDRRNAETDAIQAADFGEPTRVQIEQAIRLTQEDDLAWQCYSELEAAASVLGGRRGLGVCRG